MPPDPKDSQAPQIPADLQSTVAIALAEDIGSGDLTAALLDAGTVATASVITREGAVLCGTPWFNEVFRALDTKVTVRWRHADGDHVGVDDTLCTLTGPVRALLTGERTALNFLQTLSATATETNKYVQLISPGKTRLLDTRKTLPGLRSAQKYAVRCGGGHNHRMGLFDAVLIKENHIRAAGGIAEAVANARKTSPGVTVEVEVENMNELDQAIAAAADVAMLDNFSVDAMQIAVQHTAGQLELEASGGVEDEALRAIAATGVDYISVGALTKHIRAIDLSMRIDR